MGKLHPPAVSLPCLLPGLWCRVLLVQVETMMASLAEQQAQQTAALSCSGADLRGELERLQQQLEPLPQGLSQLQQRLVDAKEVLTGQLKEQLQDPVIAVAASPARKIPRSGSLSSRKRRARSSAGQAGQKMPLLGRHASS